MGRTMSGGDASQRKNGNDGLHCRYCRRAGIKLISPMHFGSKQSEQSLQLYSYIEILRLITPQTASWSPTRPETQGCQSRVVDQPCRIMLQSGEAGASHVDVSAT